MYTDIELYLRMYTDVWAVPPYHTRTSDSRACVRYHTGHEGRALGMHRAGHRA